MSLLQIFSLSQGFFFGHYNPTLRDLKRVGLRYGGSSSSKSDGIERMSEYQKQDHRVTFMSTFPVSTPCADRKTLHVRRLLGLFPLSPEEQVSSLHPYGEDMSIKLCKENIP